MSEIDFSYLDNISGGDKEFINDMIATFLEETPKDIDEMERELKASNWLQVGLIAHKLKSSIKMFGFESIKNMAVDIEQSGKKNENTEALPEKVPVFISKLKSALDELATHL
ncbi:hypothetical protein GC194_12990 [bacterium]|nr:hypothetical protein [bacterium]